jgi:hypothetical protein
VPASFKLSIHLLHKALFPLFDTFVVLSFADLSFSSVEFSMYMVQGFARGDVKL